MKDLRCLLETGKPKLEADQGAVAQLGERLVCNQEATGSIPVSSTKIQVSGVKSQVLEILLRPDTWGPTPSSTLGVNAASVI